MTEGKRRLRRYNEVDRAIVNKLQMRAVDKNSEYFAKGAYCGVHNRAKTELF